MAPYRSALFLFFPYCYFKYQFFDFLYLLFFGSMLSHLKYSVIARRFAAVTRSGTDCINSSVPDLIAGSFATLFSIAECKISFYLNLVL